MSSRQEEKEQRKRERLEREAAARSAAKRKRLLQLIGGVVVACVIVAGVVFALGGGGGGGDDIDDDAIKSAAEEAGCVYRAFPEEGRNHEDKTFRPSDFKTNPPTSGNHVPPGEQAPDGLYAPGNEPGIGNWVHTLEHGRILFQYRPGTDRSVVMQLQNLFNADVAGSGGAYHSVLMRNNTQMPFEVAAVAWRHYVGCEKLTPKAIDAMRLFRERIVDTAPEKAP